jgi:hypothetical protein
VVEAEAKAKAQTRMRMAVPTTKEAQEKTAQREV